MTPPEANAPRSASERRSERRRQILSAATEIFARRGYQSASIQEIIARASIARGTFYLYFESKQHVFDSILQDAIVELGRRIRPIELGADSPPPLVQLESNLARVFDYVFVDPHLSHLLVHDTADPESATRLERFLAQTQELIASSLQHGIDMGLVRPCDRNLVAAGLVGALRGMIANLLSRGDSIHTAELVQQVVCFALHGVMKEPTLTAGDSRVSTPANLPNRTP